MIRSLLFAPAVRQDFLAKLPGCGADAVVIDCEDATPPGAKADGRAIARRMGTELAAAGASPFTRVNGVDTEWFAADVADGLAPELAGVVVPMVETVDGVQARRLLRAYEAASASGIAAIDFEGQMVDEPVATQARRLIAKAP